MERTPADFLFATSMRLGRYGDRAISRRTGIPYGTLRYWRRLNRVPVTIRRSGRIAPGTWRPPDPRAYAYLLGLYLGDGSLGSAGPKSVQLVIILDASYPSIVTEAQRAIRRTAPGKRVGWSHVPGAIRVYASDPAWLAAFPQHGPGRKHTRRIELVPWQREITQTHPEALIRGLIHSDGSRCVNRFKTQLPSGRVGEYSYTRYFFTNYSADIRRIFCEHCDLLGIRWTQSSFKNISIAHRDSVAILDSFVGPKR